MRHGRHEFRLQVSRLSTSGKGLDRIAKKCVGWSIVCFLAGSIMLVAHPLIFDSMDVPAQPGGNAVMAAGQLLVTALQWSLFPTGAALIGASVVIQWFRNNLAVMPKKS